MAFDVYVDGNRVNIERNSINIRFDKQVNTCSFRVIDKTNTFGLDLWRDIEIYEDSSLIFKGYITDLTKERAGVDGWFIYGVSGESLKGLAKRRITRGDIFRECYQGDIINTLIERYLSEEGVKKSGKFYEERNYTAFATGTHTDTKAYLDGVLALKGKTWIVDQQINSFEVLDADYELDTAIDDFGFTFECEFELPTFSGAVNGVYTGDDTPVFERRNLDGTDYDFSFGVYSVYNAQTSSYSLLSDYGFYFKCKDTGGSEYSIYVSYQNLSNSINKLSFVWSGHNAQTNASLECFVNGELIGSTDLNAGDIRRRISEGFIFGGEDNPYGATSDWRLRNIRMWSKDLTTSEIQSILDAEFWGTEEGLLYYYPVRERQKCEATKDWGREGKDLRVPYSGSEGYRIIPEFSDNGDREIIIDLNELQNIAANNIEYEAQLNEQTFELYSSVSSDGGNSWSDETLLNSGDSVAGLPTSGDLASYQVKFRFHFETTDTTETAEVYRFVFRVNSANIEQGDYVSRLICEHRTIFEIIDEMSVSKKWDITSNFFFIFSSITGTLKQINMANYHKKSVYIQKDNYEYRNIQVVEKSGAIKEVNEQIKPNNPTYIIEVHYPVTGAQGKPIIYIDGVLQVVGEKGIDNDSLPILFEEGSRKLYLRNSNVSSKLFNITYKYFDYEAVEEVDATEISRVGALGVGSGKIEVSEDYGDVSELLSIYKKEGLSISFMSLADIMELGDYLDFTMSDWGIVNEIGYCVGKEITEEAGLKIFSYEIEILNKADWTKFFIGG